MIACCLYLRFAQRQNSSGIGGNKKTERTRLSTNMDKHWLVFAGGLLLAFCDTRVLNEQHPHTLTRTHAVAIGYNTLTYRFSLQDYSTAFLLHAQLETLPGNLCSKVSVIVSGRVCNVHARLSVGFWLDFSVRVS